MSWRDYADLLESGNAGPGAWGSARQANPNSAHDALVSALHSTDPHATADTLLAFVAEVERLREVVGNYCARR